MRILIAPQEFKGSLTAVEAAGAIAQGVREAQPGWELDVQPLSDGGPGFLDVLHPALGGALMRSAVVPGPLGAPVRARYLWVPATRTVYIEAAEANGLSLIPEEEREPLRANTGGVGKLVATALTYHPARVVIGVGGSGTTDGGTGMARALGARFLDAAGAQLGRGGGELVRLEQVVWKQPEALAGVSVVVATDVRSPLVGPSGAARVFAPQKGATPQQVETLEDGLVRLAEVLRRDLGADVVAAPGGGAAGGLAAGCVAFLGARVASGFDCVAEAVGLHARIAAADIVVTGEGSYDAQSSAGKVTGRVRELADAAAKRCVVFAGRAAAGEDDAWTIASREPNPQRAMAGAAAYVRDLAREWAAQVS